MPPASLARALALLALLATGAEPLACPFDFYRSLGRRCPPDRDRPRREALPR